MSINDELIWQSLNGHFCSFKAKVQRNNFCRNEQNVTGLCNKSACPLANSRYATIRELDGRCYLMIKTIERAHLPNRLWQKIKLPRNYTAALAKVTEELEHFPKFLQHRNKQRLTRIHQYLVRMRKLALRARPKITAIHKKVERREDRREVKALAAAKLSKSIEAELLQRLRQGTYGDIYNFPEMNYAEVLDREGEVDQKAAAEESDAESEEERLVEFIEAAEDDESEDELELAAARVDDRPSELSPPPKPPARAQKPRARVAIEYDDDESEAEEESPAATAMAF
mmetsp:Transcript_20397/g.62840  ORF Transcript_20397/g.62840 Transcript_20397/m.62840 type:complete len:285 (-) Transcript_20397:34-888(-)